eukprot:TRINITY_DN2439_c3_g1_i1.p1 TRINITY_DN2439_c3_g1~~TRINITY_DN2439_c3_g1_i1.p1  ORF type:complete len:417 (-),score=95.74 TRINITY_DN2439_c3_g1_i1:26-1276(-)
MKRKRKSSKVDSESEDFRDWKLDEEEQERRDIQEMERDDASADAELYEEQMRSPNSKDLDKRKNRKRYRRSAGEIDRVFLCHIPGCDRSYGTEGSLKMHVKLKHPSMPNVRHSNESQPLIGDFYLGEMSPAQNDALSIFYSYYKRVDPQQVRVPDIESEWETDLNNLMSQWISTREKKTEITQIELTWTRGLFHHLWLQKQGLYRQKLIFKFPNMLCSDSFPSHLLLNGPSSTNNHQSYQYINPQDHHHHHHQLSNHQENDINDQESYMTSHMLLNLASVDNPNNNPTVPNEKINNINSSSILNNNIQQQQQQQHTTQTSNHQHYQIPRQQNSVQNPNQQQHYQNQQNYQQLNDIDNHNNMSYHSKPVDQQQQHQQQHRHQQLLEEITDEERRELQLLLELQNNNIIVNKQAKSNR